MTRLLSVQANNMTCTCPTTSNWIPLSPRRNERFHSIEDVYLIVISPLRRPSVDAFAPPQPPAHRVHCPSPRAKGSPASQGSGETRTFYRKFRLLFYIKRNQKAKNIRLLQTSKARAKARTGQMNVSKSSCND